MTGLQQYIKDNHPELAKEFLPDSHGWTNRFPIRSETSNRLYNIAQRKSDGVWGCSCMSWIRSRTCKHLRNLQPLIDKVENDYKKTLGLNSGSEVKVHSINTSIPVSKPTIKPAVKQIEQPVQSVSLPTQTGLVRKPGLLGAVKPKSNAVAVVSKTAVAKVDATGVAVVKKKKPFVDLSKYKTYDTSEGFGSVEQWKAAFEERMNFRTFTPIEKKQMSKGLCDMLYEAPDYDTLKRLYRKEIVKYHPDIVGDSYDNKAKSQLLNDAYLEMKTKFGVK